MSFSSRSLLSLARTALRLLSRSGAGGPGPSASTRSSPKASPTSPPARGGKRSNPQSRTPAPKKPSPSSQASPKSPSGNASSSYPGDYRGKVNPRYAPSPDGSPDPGEVVWAWVPYEDDYSQGKDRPVLLIGSSGKRLLALMMTTRDRNNGRESDPGYVDVGTGSWDAQGRASEVKVDRVLQLDPASVRRQGAVLSPAAFERVRKALAARD